MFKINSDNQKIKTIGPKRKISDRGGGDHHRVDADRSFGADGDESSRNGADVDFLVFARSAEAEVEREGEGADQEGPQCICLHGS